MNVTIETEEGAVLTLTLPHGLAVIETGDAVYEIDTRTSPAVVQTKKAPPEGEASSRTE